MSLARAWGGLPDWDRSLTVMFMTGYKDWLLHKQWIESLPAGDQRDYYGSRMALGDAALLADDIKEAKRHYEYVLVQHHIRTAVEPFAIEGKKVAEQRTAAGFSSGEQRAAERKPEWDKWQQAAEEIFRANPHLTKSAICERVGKRFGKTGRGVSNHVTDVGKKVGKDRPRSNS